MHIPSLFAVVALALSTGVAAQAAAPAAATHDAALTNRPVLTLAGAKAIAAHAVAMAHQLGAPGAAVAVVDAGGNLLYVERLDGTFAMAATVSTGKARTAALFQKPTRVFEEIINKGRTAMAALPDFTPLQGGVPIVKDGQIVGAVGVSGAASAAQDDQIATAAAAVDLATAANACCTGSEPRPVAYLPAAKVAAAFAVGQPLLETGNYKIHASRREGPGRVEVHDDETDIVYVLAGSAVFVTGGAVVGGEHTGPKELRGDSITGGNTQRIVPGDVVVVPQGTPHWFREVDGPLTYYVVKVLHDARSE